MLELFRLIVVLQLRYLEMFAKNLILHFNSRKQDLFLISVNVFTEEYLYKNQIKFAFFEQ